MLKNYLKIACKVLLRQKFFTIVSLFGISITLTIVFVVVAMIDTVVTPGGRGSKLSRSLFVEEISLRGKEIGINSQPSYHLLDRHLRSLRTPEAVAIHSSNQSTTVYLEGSKIELALKYTDAAFWDIVEFEFEEGGPYTAAQVAGAEAVAVITSRTRDEVFGRRPAVGDFLQTTSGTFRIIGVVPTSGMPGQTAYADLWTPITQASAVMTRTEPHGSEMGIVLPADDGDVDAIKREFAAHMDAVRAEVADRFDSVACTMNSQLEMAAREFFGGSEGSPAAVMAVVIGLMILFMLLPAMNLVNMTVSRIYERSSEIGVRKAFGASVSTLIGQFVVENVVLTLFGGLLAVGFSVVVLAILNDSGLLPFAHFRLNPHVLFYSLIICLFFGVFSGVIPAYRMSRLHPVSALRGITI